MAWETDMQILHVLQINQEKQCNRDFDMPCNSDLVIFQIKVTIELSLRKPSLYINL